MIFYFCSQSSPKSTECKIFLFFCGNLNLIYGRLCGNAAKRQAVRRLLELFFSCGISPQPPRPRHGPIHTYNRVSTTVQYSSSCCTTETKKSVLLDLSQRCRASPNKVQCLRQLGVTVHLLAPSYCRHCRCTHRACGVYADIDIYKLLYELLVLYHFLRTYLCHSLLTVVLLYYLW